MRLNSAALVGLRVVGVAALGTLIAVSGGVAREGTAPAKVDWDQIENAKSAAARIGRVQRVKGAEVAMQLISNCYKTHTLFEHYSKGFESCLVQDHLQTRVLVEIYGRMAPDALRKIGAPSKENLVRANVARFSATLAKYNVPVAYGRRIRSLADEHGWPVFVKIVFPRIKTGQDKARNKKPTRKKQ